MMYPFTAFNDDTEITHSEMLAAKVQVAGLLELLRKEVS